MEEMLSNAGGRLLIPVVLVKLKKLHVVKCIKVF